MRAGAIRILITDEHGDVKFAKARVRRMLETLCERYGIKRGVINIVVVDDEAIQKVNRKFLKSSKKTDVISFDLSDAQNEKVFDIVVNAQRASREAKARDHRPESELVLYIVHGFLHNVGFDDLKVRAAKLMHAEEDIIMDEFGYGRPYSSGRERKS